MPDISDMPDIPHMPDILDIPDILDMPGIPNIPDVPDIPDIPAIPNVSDISRHTTSHETRYERRDASLDWRCGTRRNTSFWTYLRLSWNFLG